jgi:hypothetical protein
MKRLINMGVDAIETDYPHVLKEILRARRHEGVGRLENQPDGE